MTDRATLEAQRALMPLIRYAQRNKGTRSRQGAVGYITEQLSRMTHERQHRQLVEKWLHPDPEKRIEPRFGTGLLLMKVWDRIQKRKPS